MTTPYFRDYPVITYNNTDVKNITIRLDFLTRIKDNVSLFQYKNISDGERPEDVAYDVYNDSQLYWIILYMNNIVDPYHDWLMSEDRLLEFVKRKYGAENINNVHHYETTEQSDLGKGVWADNTTPFTTPVTNLQYETNKNEEKRKIKILKARYLQQVLTEYKDELRIREQNSQ